MSKEKVYIVISHKNVLRKNSRGASGGPNATSASDWETQETVEFVNVLKDKHITMSKASADYLNRKVISGHHLGMSSYEVFEEYVRKKYPAQMAELDAAYGKSQIAEVKQIDDSPRLVSDQFGNIRPVTVFDKV